MPPAGLQAEHWNRRWNATVWRALHVPTSLYGDGFRMFPHLIQKLPLSQALGFMFYREENQGSERVSSSYKITQDVK